MHNRMTRIDTTEEIVGSLQREVSSLKKQVETERRHRFRKLYFKLGAVALAIAVVFIGGGYALARTGVHTFRLFRWVPYEQPAPLRFVEPRAVDAAKLLSSVRPLQKRDVSIALSEEELTGVLRQALIVDAERPYFSQIQMVVTPDEVEVFGELVRPMRGYVTVGMVPRAHDGEISLQVHRLRFGQLPLPSGAANGIIQITAEKTLNTLFHQLGRLGTLSSVELRDRSMTVRIIPAHDE